LGFPEYMVQNPKKLKGFPSIYVGGPTNEG